MFTNYNKLKLEANRKEINNLKNEIEIQKHNNYKILKENEKVRNENSELRYELKAASNFINKVFGIMNNSGTIVDKYDKIKELVTTGIKN